jgi:hypothetical protein
MKLGHDNEIKYDETVGTVTHFCLILDGEPTMAILCDTADPEKIIRVRPMGASQSVQDTKGRFTTYVKMLEDADGAPLGTETRVDRKSVYGYVLPRAATLLGRLLRAEMNPCAGGKCPNPSAHAEGAHDL